MIYTSERYKTGTLVKGNGPDELLTGEIYKITDVYEKNGYVWYKIRHPISGSFFGAYHYDEIIPVSPLEYIKWRKEREKNNEGYRTLDL